MFRTVPDFYAGAKSVVEEFNKFISDYGLIELVVADHICYKVSSVDNFEEMRRTFEKDNKWLYQNIISKRRIATIRTNQHIETLVGKIDLVELSDQKPDGSQTDGFDHIEIYPVNLTYEDLVSNLKGRGLEVKEIVRPHHTTHDIKLNGGFIVRLTRDRLAEKIKKEMT